MRPRYETPEDLNREKAVALLLEGHFGAEAVKLPESYRVDYAYFSRGRNPTPVAFCEIKCRNRAYDQYPTMVLSQSKWDVLVKLAKDRWVPVHFATQLLDGLYLMTCRDVPYDVVVGGRTVDTRDEWDIEPVVLIPMTEFKKVDGHGGGGP